MDKLKSNKTIANYCMSLIVLLFFLFTSSAHAQEWYNMPEKVETKWSSFENLNGVKGEGARENNGAKGYPSDQIKAGETVTLLHVEGAGIVQRIWLTINDRSPEMLRSLKLDMYWDGADKPAVSAPLGDFFGVGLGRRIAFENELFADPEGRSFNCFIPMPFRTGAKITLTNESGKNLNSLFFDVNFTQQTEQDDNVFYFHTYWNRQNPTTLGKDFEILPKLSGRGRFLGVNMGVKTDPVYEESWFGEGEVKIYLDGDTDFPTLAGTGTEDYIGTAWGQGTFCNRYQGSLIADTEKGEFVFYRYHIPDPVYFHEDIKVTIQQIGGWPKKQVLELMENGAKLKPVTISAGPENFVKLLEMPGVNLDDESLPDGWTNFYREDDVSSTAYFYLDKPVSELPDLAPVEQRTEDMENN
ncbi:glycoside hydrolase family 172 protein [Maribellus mangrovi]|uniref:glycoside hydrolase family 172 protein n=1 Tax=Maribellus mangrovi TaxID=3133146 RepID=UPI0030EBC853